MENMLLAYWILYRLPYNNGLHRTEVPAGYVQRFGGKNLAKLDMASRFFFDTPCMQANDWESQTVPTVTDILWKALEHRIDRIKKICFIQKLIICQYERKRDGTAAQA